MDPIECPIDTRPNPLADPLGVLKIIDQAVYQLWDVANTLAQLRPPRLPLPLRSRGPPPRLAASLPAVHRSHFFLPECPTAERKRPRRVVFSVSAR